MTKGTATLVLILTVLFTLPFFFITIPLLILSYNRLIKRKNHVEFSYHSIDVMLKKRFDMIPNLVSSVKAIMGHEKSVLTEITRLRSQLSEAQQNREERFVVESELTAQMGMLSLNMENYPDLKSNQNMMHLQRTITEMEEQLGASRRAYNSSVLDFNNAIQSFPRSIMAAFMALKPSVFFRAKDSEKANPDAGSLFL